MLPPRRRAFVDRILRVGSRGAPPNPSAYPIPPPPNIIDPATLAHSGLWLAPFSAGSPLVGLASAGTSLGKNATEATNPPSVGPSFGGQASISADGVNDQLTLGGIGSDYVTDTGFSFWWLGRVNVATPSLGVILLEDGLVSDNGGAYGFSINADGFIAYIQTFAGMKQTAPFPFVLGDVVFCCARFEGSQLLAGVNVAPTIAISTPGANNMDSAYRTMKLFCNYNATAFLNCDTLGLGFSFAQFTDFQFVGMRNFLFDAFGL